jgi:hypothetical protein
MSRRIADNLKHRASAVSAKWARGKRAKLAVSAIKDDAVKTATTLFLENIDTFKADSGANVLVEEGATIGSYLDAGSVSGDNLTPNYDAAGANSAMYKPLSLALARRVFPSLFAHKLVGVQPLAGPVGIAFAMRNKYVDPATGDLTDDEAAWKKIPEYAGFSGGYEAATYDAGLTDADAVTTDLVIKIDAAIATTSGTAVVGLTGTAGETGYLYVADTTDFEIAASAKAAATADIEAAGKQSIDGTGNARFARGISVKDAERLGIKLDNGDTPAGSLGSYNELSIDFIKKTIEANERALASSFSLHALQDIKKLHDIDLKAEVTNTLQFEITSELDRELLEALKTTSIDTANGGGNVLEIDFTSASITDNRQATAILVNAILFAVNTVANATKRGPANFVVVSGKVGTLLQAAVPYFTANTAAVDPGIVLSGAEATVIGKLNNKITVYLDQFASSEYALVGYKGADKVSDAGVIFSPYVMNVQHEAVAQENFKPRVGIMSRYAVTTGLLDAGTYYRTLSFVGLDEWILGETGATDGLIGW